jgi:hypothetical protein
MEKLKELQDLAIWMSGCGYDFTQHEHFLKNKHLLTDEAINYTHSCKSDSEQLFDFLEWFNNYCTVDIKPNKEDVELYLSK